MTLQRATLVLTAIALIATLTAVTVASGKTSRLLITAAFKKVDVKGHPVVEVTNRTKRDIDDVRGSLIMEDLGGHRLFAAGQTEAVPGSVFLSAGETKELVPFGLNRKPELMERLRSQPESVRFYFDARSITYMDGSKETRLAP